MSGAINHVRLLAPEDFFAPIALIMKARPFDGCAPSRNFGKQQQQQQLKILARASWRIMAPGDDEDNGIVESDC